MKSEALLNRAKVYAKQNRPSDALKDLNGITIDTRTAIGEAKYMLSEVYYNLNQLNNAEKKCLTLQKRDSHQYWLARSFVVLSDVYIQKEMISKRNSTC